MKKNFVGTIMALALFGCGKTEAPKAPEMSVESFKQVMIAQQKTEMAEKQRQEADRQRQEADRQKKVAEEEKVKSEHVTMWTVLLAVIALFVGIAIGSSSKKDATKRRDVHDQ